MATLVASRVDEFCPDTFVTDNDGREWIYVYYGESESYGGYPQIVNYNGSIYYKMSYNSDSGYICYAESLGRPYHERYI